MDKASVLLIDTMHPLLTSLLQEGGCKVVEGYTWSREEVIRRISEFAAIAIRSRFKIDADFIRQSQGLRCIARAGAGMENIDTEAASTAGIVCVNAPEGNSTAVGEHALGMLLALNNHLIRADAEVRRGIWRREENRGQELEGKTVAIIGFGNMGKSFAKRLRGLEVQQLVYDPYIKVDSATFPFVEQCDMKKIFEEADVVSLHIPLSSETTYLVNEDWIDAFKKNFILINTARGKNVNTAALCEGLKTGKISGAALDVLEYESISFEHIESSALPAPFQYLIQAENVLLSPHIGGWTHESNEKIACILAKKILKVISKD
jgi:D-3-phosphoglycerate dehydrogenase